MPITDKLFSPSVGRLLHRRPGSGAKSVEEKELKAKRNRLRYELQQATERHNKRRCKRSAEEVGALLHKFLDAKAAFEATGRAVRWRGVAPQLCSDSTEQSSDAKPAAW